MSTSCYLVGHVVSWNRQSFLKGRACSSVPKSQHLRSVTSSSARRAKRRTKWRKSPGNFSNCRNFITLLIYGRNSDSPAKRSILCSCCNQLPTFAGQDTEECISDWTHVDSLVKCFIDSELHPWNLNSLETCINVGKPFHGCTWGQGVACRKPEWSGSSHGRCWW